METILEKLQEYGLTAKMAKCQWEMAECTYLGYVVDSGYVKPEINKLEAVENFPVPKTKKEIRSFLGLTGYYRHFASLKAVPLTNLARKNCSKIVV